MRAPVEFCKKAYATVFLLFVMIMLTSPAFADTVQGKIANMNTSGVNLAVYDAKGQVYPNFLRLEVSDAKQLSSLRAYDWVKADVKQKKSGAWEATKISRIKTPKLSDSGAPFEPMPQPSSNIMDSLKSPEARNVVRGSLLGAITGAIASGASGGKAGKGALIGMATGAVGGILQNIFAPSSQPQYAQAPPSAQYYQPKNTTHRVIRHYDSDGHVVSEEEIK